MEMGRQERTWLCTAASEDNEVRVPLSPYALEKKIGTHPWLKKRAMEGRGWRERVREMEREMRVTERESEREREVGKIKNSRKLFQ